MSDAGKRYPLNIRTTKEMREKLGDAARRSGRSLTQEMEFRLEQSFIQEDISRALIETIRSEMIPWANRVDAAYARALARTGQPQPRQITPEDWITAYGTGLRRNDHAIPQPDCQ